MTTRLIAILGAILAIAGCDSATSDTSTQPAETSGLVSSGAADTPDNPTEAPETNALAGSNSDPSSGPSSQASAAPSPGPSVTEHQEVVLPNGTVLLLSLMTGIGSDTSAVEDAVRAELSEAVAVEGREVLPVGAQVEGSITGVDVGGRVTGRATITFRLTSIRVAGEPYEMQAAPVSEMAPATRGEDAKKIGIGVGAGALIGGLLGGGVGAGVVLATRGADVRLESGAAVITELTSPLTVRVLPD